MTVGELIEHLVSLGGAVALAGSEGNPRADAVPLDWDVLTVWGMPGAGKTAFLLGLGHRLVETDPGREAVAYVDLGDARLADAGAALPALVVDAFYRLHPAARAARCTFLLDGIDAVSDWQDAVRRLLDVYDARFAVALRGCARAEAETFGKGRRVRTVGLGPLSFAEYAALRPAARRSSGSRDGGLLESYCAEGGLPGALRRPPLERIAYLQGLVRGAVADGPCGRAGAARYAVGEAFAAYALGRASHPLSITRAAAELARAGHTASRPALALLLEGLAEAGIVHALGDCGHERPGEGRLPRTVYAGDMGLMAAFAPGGVPSRADALRNAALLELMRRGLGASVRSLRVAPGKSVDFAVVPEGTPAGESAVEEVVHFVDEDAAPHALRRAVGLLGGALMRVGLSEAVLLTVHTAGFWVVGSGAVRAVPIEQWLLEGPAGGR